MEKAEIYRYLFRRHKRYSRELKVLREEKLKAVSEGTEKAAYLKVKNKETEIKLVERVMEFLDTGIDIEKETWDKGLPIVKNEGGELVNYWSDGRVEKVKIVQNEQI